MMSDQLFKNDIKYYCKKCMCDTAHFYYTQSGPHIGCFCSEGHFISWISKEYAKRMNIQISKPKELF